MLGTRLIECTNAVLGHAGTALHAFFGPPDDLKFISSMTLFAAIDDAPDTFARALNMFNAGQVDARTRAMLNADSSRN